MNSRKLLYGCGFLTVAILGVIVAPIVWNKFVKEKHNNQDITLANDENSNNEFEWPKISENDFQNFLKHNNMGDVVIDPLVIPAIIKDTISRFNNYKGKFSFGYQIKNNEILLKLIYNIDNQSKSKLYRIYLKSL